VSLISAAARLARDYANVNIESNAARYDAWQLTTSLLYYGGKVISFGTQTVLLYRLLSTIQSRWVSPALFVIWGIRALPSLESETTRMWMAGECRSCLLFAICR
jgi:hypothetical protein